MSLDEIERQLRNSILDDDGWPGAAHISLPNDGGSFKPERLARFATLFGVDSDEHVVAGWWTGWNGIGQYADQLGVPLGDIVLLESSDLSWRLWQCSMSKCLLTSEIHHQSPNVLTTDASDWILLTGPADRVSYLYTKVS